MSLNKKIGFKLLSGIVLLTMFSSILSPILFYPEPAQAQFADIAHTAMQIGKFVWEKVSYFVKEAWRIGGAVAYKNALNVYLGQMAQQSAEYVASGGKGQKPLFLTDPQYWKKAGDEALGEFIDKTAQASGFINQSLCDPLDPQLKFKLLISIPDISAKMPVVPQNKLCSLSKIKKAQSDSLKKNLVSFGTGTETGDEFGAKLEQLNQLYNADTSISDSAKGALGCFKDEINASFNNITGYLNEINQKWPDVAAITNEGLLDKLKTENKNLWSLISFEEGKGEKCFSGRIPPLAVPISTCSNASVDDFCNNQECRNYCKDFNAALTCAEQYASKCKPQTQKTDTYHQQLLAQIIEIVARVDKFVAGVESQSYEGNGPNTTLEDLQKDMAGSGSDLGALMTLSDEAKKEKDAKEKEKSLWSLINGPAKGVEGVISGKTLTPSFLIDAQGRKAIEDGTASVGQYTGAAVADAISIFTGTLAKKLLERFKKGMNPSEDPGTSWSLDPSGKVVFNPGATEAKVIMADLATVAIKSGGQVNLLDNYSSFIDQANYVMPDTNVIDAGFRRAIEEKMSISEAMEKNLLKGNWTVGEIGQADGFNDCNKRFSLTNIKKLRRARIVPLGLEIAATKIADKEVEDKNFTLKEVVDGFNQEGTTAGCQGTAIDSTESSFCHLVDPNWVLSIPQFFCESRGYGAVPIASSNQRQEVCVDMQDCLKTDEKGQCLGWGYCTREKNIWRFGGDECSKQYESCSIYKNIATGAEKSFVKNTINFSGCDQNNVGCKWYCKNYDTVVVDGKDIKTWTCSKPEMVGDQSNAIYFNKNISTCSNDNEGCHEYIQTTVNSGVNLIPNGSFENYNIDNNLTSVNGWSVENGTFLVDQISAYSGKVVAKISAAGGNPYINVDLLNPLPLPLVAGQKYTFSAWVNPVATTTLYLKGGAAIELSSQEINQGWQRLVYTFNYPLIANGLELDVRTLRWEPSDATVVYFDDFQLEPGANTTPYKEYASVNKIYLKSAPDYLKCGTTNEDPVKCANFTKKCNVNQVGCELYTSVSSNSAFPAVVKNEDRCPSDCVGYNTFRQSATNFEDAAPFINFIPATGKACSVSDAGCEEFTNLDEVTKGGEGKEYYSYLRQCVKTDQNNNPVAIGAICTPYYTWVGSDTTGYQLKKYYLQGTVDTDNKDTGPAVVSVSNQRLDLGLCAGVGDILVNPHCKQFYSATGQVYYRIYENTISCSQDCHPLRKTARVDSAYCPTDVPGTSYDDVTGTCVYMAIPSEGVSCSKTNVGCREYKGNNANNMKNLFNDQFETIDNDTGLWSAVAPSTESINLGGHSILVTNLTSRSVKDLVKKDKSYLLTMWVKGAGTYSTEFSSDLSFGSKSIIGNEWQEIKLGPVNLSEVINLPESLTISGPTTFYLDNIVLKEITSNIYLIKNSWKTPAVCASDMVGCDSYKDRTGKFSYLKSFSSLCPDDKVGCDIVIDTRNSSSPFSQEFNKNTAVLTDDVNVPTDSVDYLVIDPKKTCQAEFKGCQRFGLPTLDIDGAVVGWSDQYLKNDPDLYDRRPILCDQNGEGCEEFFDTSANSKSYFRDPKDRLCEYRKNVNLVSEVKSGWFKKGTNQACYYNTEAGPNQGKPYQPDGLTYGIYWANENNYDNWVGACPSSQNGCTSFVDTQATAILNLVKNGNFEDGLTLTPPWYDATPYNFVNSVTVGIAEEGENKLLSIDSSTTPPASFKSTALSGMSWFAAAVTQQIKPSISLPGSNYVVKAKVKVDNLKTPIKIADPSYTGKSIAHLSVDLNFEGISGVPLYTDPTAFTTGEWQDWAACYEWDGVKWVGKDLQKIVNGVLVSGEGGNSILDCIDRLPAPNDIPPCSYDPATLTNSSVPLARCLLALKSAGLDVINNANTWAWVITHGYWTNASIFIIYQDDLTMIDGNWHDFSQVITAAGPLNPRSLKIKEASVNFRIIDQSYTADTMGIGKASLDDVEIKALEPYYYINNTKLDRTSCNGQVSSKAGCILFLDSSLKDNDGIMPLTYNSVATYKKSDANNYNLVTPIDCKNALSCAIGANNEDTDYCKYCYKYNQTRNDTNAIIKVVRDRECGEWLTCATATPQWSKTGTSFKNVCNYVMRCDQLSDNAGVACANPVVVDNPEVLNETVYTDRDVSWSGMDYSGYSLYNMYPVEYLAPRQVSTATPDLYTYELRYKDGVKGVDGAPISSPEQPSLLKSSIKKTCSLYPEIDSPFIPGLSDKYPEINVCQENDVNKTPNAQNDLYKDCQCAYAKGDYSGTMKYFNYSNPVWLGISSDESQIKSEPCLVGDPSGCIPLSKKKTAIGQRGYCLEQDLSVPGELNSCLTWWPGGAATGDPDIYNQYTSAGYFAPDNRKFYCLNISPVALAFNYSYTGCDGDVDPGATDTYTSSSPLYWYTLSVAQAGRVYYKDEISSIRIYLYANDNAGDCWGDGGSGGNYYLQASNSWQQYAEEGGAGIVATAQFDSLDQLTGISLSKWDQSAGSATVYHGYHDHDGENTYEPIIIQLKNACQYIANIEDNNTNQPVKAWTDRLFNYGSSSLNTYNIIPGVNWNKECTPYSAIDGPGTRFSYLFDAANCTTVGTRRANNSFSKGELSNLFATAKEIKKLDSSLFYGVCPLNDTNCSIWDATGPLGLGQSVDAPKVASVQCEGGEMGGSCKLKEINKITINDEDTEGLASTGKIYPVTLKFYAWADKNHMPIREVLVDWGDGTPMSGNGNMLAKNHKPMCCTSKTNCDNLNACDVNKCLTRDSVVYLGNWQIIYDTYDYKAGETLLNFGNIPDACASTYFQFNHLYFCPGPGTCSFQPKVYVKDNWGWCNDGEWVNSGSCAPSTPAPSQTIPGGHGISFNSWIKLSP